jgi:hypothetical protein
MRSGLVTVDSGGAVHQLRGEPASGSGKSALAAIDQ